MSKAAGERNRGKPGEKRKREKGKKSGRDGEI
jgi:hypothetical protein